MPPAHYLDAIGLPAGELRREKGSAGAGMDGAAGGNPRGVMGGILGGIGTGPAPVVKAAAPKKIAVSAGVIAGNKIGGVDPRYPPIGRAARIQGTVVLQATISKAGTIENLRVLSGPPILQRAPSRWRRLEWVWLPGRAREFLPTLPVARRPQVTVLNQEHPQVELFAAAPEPYLFSNAALANFGSLSVACRCRARRMGVGYFLQST